MDDKTKDVDKADSAHIDGEGAFTPNEAVGESGYLIEFQSHWEPVCSERYR